MDACKGVFFTLEYKGSAPTLGYRPQAQGADVVIKQFVNRETDKYNTQGTTSTTALCMLFHALQSALIEETDYQKEQFALIHPGGAVGERLNKKGV